MEGLICEYSIPGCVQSGTGFPDGRGFGNRVPEFAFGMGCGFRLRAWRKVHPRIRARNGMQFPVEASTGKPVPESQAQTGMRFPVEASSGNRVPESAPKVGHTFRTGYQTETASHSRHEFRVAISANKEGHKCGLQLTYVADVPTTSHASAPRRLPGRRGM